LKWRWCRRDTAVKVVNGREIFFMALILGIFEKGKGGG
jgi:hypothetical protein